MMQIRKLRFTDIFGVYRLFMSFSEETRKFFYPFPYDIRLIVVLVYLAFSNKFIKYLKKFLPKISFLSFIAIDSNGRIIGFVYLRFFDCYVAKLGIAVHDDFRGLGVGSNLIRYIDEIAEIYDIKKIYVNVVKENIKAYNFYIKNKFKEYKFNNMITLYRIYGVSKNGN